MKAGAQDVTNATKAGPGGAMQQHRVSLALHALSEEEHEADVTSKAYGKGSSWPYCSDYSTTPPNYTTSPTSVTTCYHSPTITSTLTPRPSTHPAT